jgi:hypothetical protein
LDDWGANSDASWSLAEGKFDEWTGEWKRNEVFAETQASADWDWNRARAETNGTPSADMATPIKSEPGSDGWHSEHDADTIKHRNESDNALHSSSLFKPVDVSIFVPTSLISCS